MRIGPWWLDVERLGEILTAEHLICLAFLLGISVYDIWFRRISGFVLLVAGILAAGCTVVKGAAWWPAAAAGALAGAMLLLTARLTREAVGYGDGWLVTVLGLYLGFWQLMEVLASAWVLLACAACICLARKRWSRKAALPMATGRSAACFSWRRSTRGRSGRKGAHVREGGGTMRRRRNRTCKGSLTVGSGLSHAAGGG